MTMARWLALFFLAGGAAAAGDRDFERIVKAIEAHYGTKPTHIPFMGAARFFAKAARPEGVSDFNLAVFEDFPADSNGGDLDAVISSLDTGMRPLVEVRSNGGEEATYIYAQDAGKYVRMLLVTLDPHEATVLEAKVAVATFMEKLAKPDGMSQWFRHGGGETEE